MLHLYPNSWTGVSCSFALGKYHWGYPRPFLSHTLGITLGNISGVTLGNISKVRQGYTKLPAPGKYPELRGWVPKYEIFLDIFSNHELYFGSYWYQKMGLSSKTPLVSYLKKVKSFQSHYKKKNSAPPFPRSPTKLSQNCYFPVTVFIILTS